MKNTYSFYALLKDHSVIIPLIQRDYAQGRKNNWVNTIREDFLEALYQAVSKKDDKKPLIIDFIYGEVEKQKSYSFAKFYPFDGQQRLTTLFLLHCYGAVKAKEKPQFLNNFKYLVRESSRLFLHSFINEFILNPPVDFAASWSKTIRDQPWYINQWDLDPTIAGMLTMLDAIDEKFDDCAGLWQKLSQNQDENQNLAPILFYFTPLKNLSLSADEIYVKMNARGKQLTEFENFKAQLLADLKDQAANKVDNIAKKLDGAWSLLFWNLTQNSTYGDKESDLAQLSDKAFMRFIRYFLKIAYYLGQYSDEQSVKMRKAEKDTIQKEFLDLMANVNKAFNYVIHPNCHNDIISHFGAISTNLDLFENMLDCLVCLAKLGVENIDEHFKNCFCIDEHFENCFYIADTNHLNPIFPEKIALFTAIGVDGDKNSVHFLKALIAKDSGFGFQNEIMLFACLIAFIKHNNDGENPLDLERENLRILRNLVVNSSNEIREDNFSALLQETAALMLTGSLRENGAFNGFQTAEELRKKIAYRQLWQDEGKLIDDLNCLENHVFLQGSIGIFEDKEIQDGKINADKIQASDVEALAQRLSQGSQLFCALTLDEPNDDQISLLQFMQAMLTEEDYYYELSKNNWDYFRCGYGKVKDISGAYPSFTQIFVPKDQERREKCREALFALCDLIKDKTNIAQEIEQRISAWLADCENAEQLCWRYYLLKYPKMLSDPEFSDYGLFSTIRGRFSSEIFRRQNRKDGNYQNCCLRQLFHTMNKDSFQNEQNPLFKDDDIYQNRLKLSDNYFLESGEFSWRLVDKDGKELTTATQLQKIAAINKRLSETNPQLPQINQDGYIEIKGVEKTRPKDHNGTLIAKYYRDGDAFNSDNMSISAREANNELYRDYDQIDRIKLMKAILTIWRDLEFEAD